MIAYAAGFNLSAWQTQNRYGPKLTPEQTHLLWRQLGIEEYVGVGCSVSEPPFTPQTQSGWNVHSSKIILYVLFAKYLLLDYIYI